MRFLGFVALSIALAVPASARDFSVEIRVADEGELRQLYYDGLIDDEELDLLLRLLESPIDINRVGASDLVTLPGITPSIAQSIVDARDADGPFTSMLDLAARVDVITPSIKEQLTAFVVAYHKKGKKLPVRGGAVAASSCSPPARPM